MNPAGSGSAAKAKSPGRGHLDYGWVVVGAAFILMAGFLASPMCFGLFVKPLEEEFGWTRAAVSGALSLSMGVSGIVGVVVGRFSDRYNVGLTLAVGAIAGAGSYLLLSWASSLWHLYACFGVGMGICAGCAYAPVTATVSKWFTTKRTLALGIVLSGIILGQMALAPVLGAVIDGRGWRAGYLVVAVVTLALGAPGVVLLSRRPRVTAAASSNDAGTASIGAVALEGYTTREAIRTAPFWMLIAASFTTSAGFYIFVTHIVPCAEELGVSGPAAALILTLSGIGSLGGTYLAGWLSIRLSGRRALLLLVLGQVVTIPIFLATRSPWSFYLVSILYGFCFSASVPVRIGMVAPLFGLKSVGSILGYATLAWSVGGVVSPFASGYIHDATKSYTWVFIAGCVLLFVGAVSVFFWGEHRHESSAAA